MSFPLEPDGPAAREVAPPQFGVDGEQAERDWPLITHDEVAAVLARIDGVGVPARLTWHSPRPFSAAVLVRTDDERALFVKRHHASLRDVEGLAEEHRFIAHLRAHGCPVPDVLAGRDGATAFAFGDWTYEVHVVAPGVDAYRGVMSWKPFAHPSHAYAAGRALAQLHRASAGYDAPARPIRTLLSSFRVLSSADLAGALERWVEAQPLLVRALGTRDWRADVAATIEPYHARVVPLLPALAPLWTHGDWHASNLLWTDAAPGAQVRTVLDFGLSDRTCAVMDVALAIERNMIDWLAPADARRVEYEQIDALLDGYESLDPLSDDAYAALVALLPIVHTEFALSEVAYFGCIVNAPDIVDVAYDGYLLGHARWFGGRDGRQLLDWLEQRRRGKRGRA
ncbi:phosphotransferase [Burkholderia multivorans]|uniref:phosphotransferase enzyme family protein n=1 Tax=Burkholderia multivorans TaxID=87883 RepID=UPI000D3B7B5E|nr:phosphotransferase [Burkholderia multivorans]MBR8016781.1 phosphotransferase [Burkholderia multivorans]MEB2509361.1 phosphotransferase [Burkholderia multivorans]MEB2524919.1 phosphotransferase [Burkholderia multivorans]MEB2572785.1 phosphotransferase [Burkholderia multivorans]MEB2595314.1 phosphotransferase [Burkholderia multivorans]